MITESREKKLVKRSNFPLLSVFCVTLLNELVWRKPKNFIERKSYQEVVPVLDEIIEKALDKAFYYIDRYDERLPERHLFEALKTYVKVKQAEENLPLIKKVKEQTPKYVDPRIEARTARQIQNDVLLKSFVIPLQN